MAKYGYFVAKMDYLNHLMNFKKDINKWTVLLSKNYMKKNKRILIIYNIKKTKKKEAQLLVDKLDCDDSILWNYADRCGVEIFEISPMQK